MKPREERRRLALTDGLDLILHIRGGLREKEWGVGHRRESAKDRAGEHEVCGETIATLYPCPPLTPRPLIPLTALYRHTQPLNIYKRPPQYASLLVMMAPPRPS